MERSPQQGPDRLAGRGDPGQSFAELYDEEMPRLYRYIRCRVGSREEAEDLTADVFQRALKSWPRTRARLRSPRAWLFSIASNRVADHHRRRQFLRVISMGQAAGSADDNPEPEEEALQQQEVAELLGHLGELSERDRSILSLRFGGELSHREIGQVLRISEGAAAVALLRALRRLRRCYEGEVS